MRLHRAHSRLSDATLLCERGTVEKGAEVWSWMRRGATAAELAVVCAILGSCEDRRATLLGEQFRRSGRVARRVAGPTLTVTVPWTTDDLMVDLDEDVVSDAVEVHERRSGLPLCFRVHLARGGFLRCLEGRADGRWPRRWDVDDDELEVAAEGSLRLPGDVAPDALADWLGIGVARDAGVVVRRPATAASVGELERRNDLPLPDDVAELLEATDGLVVGDWALLGVRDLHVVEVGGTSYWQVAVGVGDLADRRCLVTADGGLVIVPSHDACQGDFEPLGVRLRAWFGVLAAAARDGP